MDPRRIIDANANRAREALRVLEDAARFLLDDATTSGACKGLRHELIAALRPLGDTVQARDVQHDVGTRLEVAGEVERPDVAAVVRAAGGRAGEALRAIEEFAKIESPDVARAVERLRYQAYEIERRLAVAIGPRDRPQWRLCVLITESVCHAAPWDEIALAAVDGGADCLQLREPGLGDRALLDRARRLRRITQGRADLVVNDRPDIARLADADGVHVGQGDLAVADVRRIVGPRILVGVSTSTIEEAGRAHADGADGCGVGPMFPSGTKAKSTIVGPEAMRAYAAWGRLPHLAIGGVNRANLGAVLDAGAAGVAVCAAVCAASDPDAARAASAALRAEIDRARLTEATPVGGPA